MNRKQFTFYESFFTAISRIRKKPDRADAYDAIAAYALYGQEPDLDKLPDSAAIAFDLIRPTLDASKRKAESGKAGGRSKQTASKQQANGKQTGSTGEANRKRGETGTAKEREIEKEKEREIENECYSPPTPSPGEPRKRFVPPTVEEVRAYCLERGNGIDPQGFVDHYEARGWRYNGNVPMKDWRAAVRTWEGRDRSQCSMQPRESRRKSFAEIAAEMDREEGFP